MDRQSPLPGVEKRKGQRALPFQNLTSDGWQNLALVAVLAFYILLVGFDLASHNLCGNLAVDYCAYWSAGKFIEQHGYADLYDLSLLTPFQKAIYPHGNTASGTFEVEPLPYLPVFVIPFRFLSILNLESSFLVWTLLNLVGFIVYLRFFTKEVSGRSLPVRLILLVMLSSPVFLNLFKGQVNIWLGICAGEFMRAMISGKPYKAGFWLGGWLLKPQFLVLILPVLLLQRSIKVLAGFTFLATTVLGVSYGMIGTKGFASLFTLMLGFAQGEAANNNPEIMMNWRMLGWHLSANVSPFVGWMVIGLGSFLTILAVLIMFIKPIPPKSDQFVLALFGLFAATGLSAWHAHLSVSMILIPPMVFLVMRGDLLKKLLSFWTLMPAMMMILVYILAALIQVDVIPAGFTQLLNFLLGLPGLVLNLLFLVWAVRRVAQAQVTQASV